jgi:hypothetical protein
LEQTRFRAIADGGHGLLSRQRDHQLREWVLI